jgi:OOP family OmpA-OmpF porin
MKLNTMKIGILVAAGVIPLAQHSYADNRDKEAVHAYVGVNYGGYKSRGDEFDDNNDFYGGDVGVFISQYFGIEGSYEDFGKIGGDLASAEVDGYGVAAIGRLPLSETFALYIKGGYFWWSADVDVGPFSKGVDGEDPFYGVGVDFAVSDHFNLSLEYDRFKVDLSDSSLPDTIDDYKSDIDTVKVGAKFLF